MLLNYQGSVIAALLGLALAAYFANRILSIEVTDNKVKLFCSKKLLYYWSFEPFIIISLR